MTPLSQSAATKVQGTEKAASNILSGYSYVVMFTGANFSSFEADMTVAHRYHTLVVVRSYNNISHKSFFGKKFFTSYHPLISRKLYFIVLILEFTKLYNTERT